MPLQVDTPGQNEEHWSCSGHSVRYRKRYR